MNKFQEKFNKEVQPKMMEEFGYTNKMAVPKIDKVTINAGLSAASKSQTFLEDATRDLRFIAGQAPVITKAKKAISGFKIRQGQDVGIMVTLRGKKMWDFLYRLVAAAIPRTKDFQGIDKKNFDGQGNLSLGIKEQLIFPEIKSDDIDTIFGFQVNVTNTAANKEEGIRLFKLLGFPIKE